MEGFITQTPSLLFSSPFSCTHQIYFNTTNVIGNLQLYNNIYNSILGTSTWAQLLDREVARVVPNAMLKLRHDAHMFHQVSSPSGCYV